VTTPIREYLSTTADAKIAIIALITLRKLLLRFICELKLPDARHLALAASAALNDIERAETVGDLVKSMSKSLQQIPDSAASVVPSLVYRTISPHFKEDVTYLAIAHLFESFHQALCETDSRRLGLVVIRLATCDSPNEAYHLMTVTYPIIDCRAINSIVQNVHTRKAIHLLAKDNAPDLTAILGHFINWVNSDIHSTETTDVVEAISNVMAQHLISNFGTSLLVTNDLTLAFSSVIKQVNCEVLESAFTTFKVQYSVAHNSEDTISTSLLSCLSRIGPLAAFSSLPVQFCSKLSHNFMQVLIKSSRSERYRYSIVAFTTLVFMFELCYGDNSHGVNRNMEEFFDRIEGRKSASIVNLSKSNIPCSKQLDTILKGTNWHQTMLRAFLSIILKCREHNTVQNLVFDLSVSITQVLKDQRQDTYLKISEVVYGMLVKLGSEPPVALSPVQLEEIIMPLIDNLDPWFVGQLSLDIIDATLEHDKLFDSFSDMESLQYLLTLIARRRESGREIDADDLIDDRILSKDTWEMMHLVNFSDTLHHCLTFVLHHPEKAGQIVQSTIRKVFNHMKLKNTWNVPENLLAIFLKEVLKHPDFIALFGVHFADLMVRPLYDGSSLVPRPLNVINMVDSLLRGDLPKCLKYTPVLGDALVLSQHLGRGDLIGAFNRCMSICAFLAQFDSKGTMKLQY
jgi:hypothetical protein